MITYGSPEITPVVIWSEIVLSLLVLNYIRRYAAWEEFGYGPFKWVNLLFESVLMVIGWVVVFFKWRKGGIPPLQE